MTRDPSYDRTPQKKNSVAAWIIGIIVAVAVIWAIGALFNRNGDVEQPTTGDEPGATQPGMEDDFQRQPLDEPLPQDEPLPGEPSPTDEPGMLDEQQAGEGAETGVLGGAGRGTGPMVITEDSQLAENPEAFVGRDVAAQGEVNEVYGARLFALDTDGAIGGDEVLVLIQEDMPVAKDAKFRIQGTVEILSKEDLSQRAGGEVSEELFAEGPSRAVIVAETIEPVEAAE